MGVLHRPLQDAGVFPTGGEKVTVVVQKGNISHVTAVATALVTRSLHRETQERAELVRSIMATSSCCTQALVLTVNIV